jgi:hypothetical protein
MKSKGNKKNKLAVSFACYIFANGQQCVVSIGQHCTITNCYLLKRRKEIRQRKEEIFWRRVAFGKANL